MKNTIGRELYSYTVTVRADRSVRDAKTGEWLPSDCAQRVIMVDAFGPEDLLRAVSGELTVYTEVDGLRISEEYIVDVHLSGKVEYVAVRTVIPEVSGAVHRKMTKDLPQFWFRKD